MASYNWPPQESAYWLPPIATAADLPDVAFEGSVVLVLDENALYEYLNGVWSLYYNSSSISNNSWKAPARLATTADHALSGLAAIDGTTPVAGNRILVKAQTLTENNGIYVAAAGAWSRASDADSAAKLNGAIIYVSSGATFSGRVFAMTSSLVSLATPQSWTQIAGVDMVTASGVAVLTNKTIDGDVNTLQDIGIASLKTVLGDANKALVRDAAGAVVSAAIVDANVASGAAIAVSKLAAVTASRALVSDGSGFVSASSVTATTLDFLDATSSVQTQLDAKASTVFVQQLANGIRWKQPVKVATTAAITLSGAQTIDGVSVVALDRVLVKNQVATDTNGIYIAAAGAWSRATDADAFDELNNAVVIAAQGTANADKGFQQINELTALSDPQSWIQNFGANLYSADGQGIEVSSGIFSLELDGTTLSKSASGLRVSAAAVLAIGDGAVGAPAFAFNSDPDTGWYSSGANDISLATNGVQRLRITTSSFTTTVPLRTSDGSTSGPSHSFANDADTGLYRKGNGSVGFVSDTVEVGSWAQTGAFVHGPTAALTDIYHLSNGSMVGTRTGALTGSMAYASGSNGTFLSTNMYADAAGFKKVTATTGWSFARVQTQTSGSNNVFDIGVSLADAGAANAAIGSTTTLFAVTGAGVLNMGPTVTGNSNGVQHKSNGYFYGGNVTSTGSSGSFGIGTNVRYPGANAAEQGRTDTTTGGAGVRFANRTADTTTAIGFYVNKNADATSTAAIEAGAIAQNSTWILGDIAKIGSSDYPGQSIVGATDGSTVAAGYVGRLESANSAGVTPGASAAFKTVTSLTLTPGRWYVRGVVQLSSSGLTSTVFGAALSLTTDALDVSNLGNYSQCLSGAFDQYLAAGSGRIINVSASTTIYLVGRLVYTILGSTTFGSDSYIVAQRMV